MTARRPDRRSDLWVATCAIAGLYVGSTVLTPLYPLYRAAFGFSQLTVTIVYAIYALGNLTVLFLFGRVSDRLGRRPAALLALCLTLVSAGVFLLARGTSWLLVGRALNGFAAGLGAAALTAWIAELEPAHDRSRAAVIASAGNLGGLAVGGLLAGVLAQYGPAPLRMAFLLYMAALAVTTVLLSRAHETIETPVSPARALRQRPRIGVPREIRWPFAAAACMAFAAFALGGFFAALIPGLITKELGSSNVALIGAVAALFFGVAALAAATTRRWSSWTAMLTGAGLVFPGVGLLMAAEAARSLVLLLAASAVAGVAMALSYRGSLQVVNEIAPSERRAEVVSSYLLMCYLGNAMPVLGAGFLYGLLAARTAHHIFAALVAVLAVIALVVGSTRRHAARGAHASSA